MTEITFDKYDQDGVFAVVVEWKTQGPILMEAEGENSSLEKAEEAMKRLLAQPTVLRACVVRLTCVGGNELLLKDMKRMQS